MHTSHSGLVIHNFAIVGKDGVGKTKVAEHLVKLYNKQKTPEYTIQPEEESRNFTIYNRIFHYDSESIACNVLDTPGNTDFISGIKSALFASTSAIFVTSAAGGAEGALRVWENVIQSETPRAIFVNMFEEPSEKFDTVIENIEKSFALRPVVLFIPWYEGEALIGIIDVINKKLIKGAPGKVTVEAMPADAEDNVELYRGTTYERIAELDDELMEYFIEEKPAPEELLTKVMSKGVKSCAITPVIVGSARKGIGLETLSKFMTTNFPPHSKGKIWKGKSSKDAEAESVERNPTADDPFSGFVFRTTFDRYVGKLSYIRVISGVLKKGLKLFNPVNSAKIQTGKILILNGDKTEEIEEAYPGDIVVIEKEDELATNHTICDINQPVLYPPIQFLEPRCTSRLELTNSSKDGRIMDAVNKLMAQDPSLKMSVDPDTKEVLFSGMGSVHLEVAREHLSHIYEVELKFGSYQIGYRETIVGRATVQGKFKKQSGGHGQYGDVHIKVEPLPRGEGFEFQDQIVGGVIPRNYIPSVEKGVRDALLVGTLAGYPVVDIRVALFDGSYHDVDSSDYAFQRAGAMAIHKALPEAKPVILEPVMELEIDVLEADVGKITKDLSGRRGKVTSYSYGPLTTTVHAEAPLAELTDYSQSLRGMTLGLGLFNMKLKSYEILSSSLAEKVIANRKVTKEEE